MVLMVIYKRFGDYQQKLHVILLEKTYLVTLKLIQNL